MNILLFGPPASGKGTQAKILASKGYNHISTGEMLRAAVKAGTPLGNRIAALLAEGHLASDEIVNELVAERLKDGCDNCLFDGYPRTVPQAIFMDTLRVRVDLIVNLKVDIDILLERIKGRFEAEGRSDDNVDAFMQRLDEYRRVTHPVMPYYARNLSPPMIVHIDGTRAVEDIAEQIDLAIRGSAVFA
jgi:adenylate kinase